MFDTGCTRCGRPIVGSSLTTITALYHMPASHRDFAEHTLCDDCRDAFHAWLNEDTEAVPAVAALGDRICALRADRGWTLGELSRRAGVSRSYLYQIESGKSDPTVSKAVRLARAFGLSLAQLVGEAAE